MQRKYFLYDPAGDGFQTFSAKEQRDAAAQKAIADCLQDGYWIDDVFAITVGEITGVAGKANVIHRPDSLNENGEDEDGDYWDRDVEEKHDVEIQSVADTSAPQAEIAALREKLAAAEQQIEGKQAVIEASKAAINGQVKDCLKVEDDYADFRAAVAAAMAELRAEWVRQIAYYETRQSESDYAERLAELEIRLRELDVTIAKLDLAEKEKSNG